MIVVDGTESSIAEFYDNKIQFYPPKENEFKIKNASCHSSQDSHTVIVSKMRVS
jgi:hypothetical protein